MIPNTARSLTLHLSRTIPTTSVEVGRYPSSSSEVEDKLNELASSEVEDKLSEEFAPSELEDKLIEEFASSEVEDKLNELASRNKVR